jgi:hypothetical protein
MGELYPIITCLCIKMYLRELKNKLFNKKTPGLIDSAKYPPDRMPIAKPGLVQLSFIPNLI